MLGAQPKRSTVSGLSRASSSPKTLSPSGVLSSSPTVSLRDLLALFLLARIIGIAVRAATEEGGSVRSKCCLSPREAESRPYRIRERSLIVLPATMNDPRPRWWMVRGCSREGSHHALRTSSTKRL